MASLALLETSFPGGAFVPQDGVVVEIAWVGLKDVHSYFVEVDVEIDYSNPLTPRCVKNLRKYGTDDWPWSNEVSVEYYSYVP